MQLQAFQTYLRIQRPVCKRRSISEIDNQVLPFYTSEVSTGISTLEPFHPTHLATTTVTTVRLDTFIQDHDLTEVNFLKTDTEGFDLQVLRTFPWESQSHPLAVVCEFEDRKTEPLGYVFGDLADFLVGLGYTLLVSEWYPVIEYGMQHRWRSLRRYPTSLHTPAAWGNILAVHPSLTRRTELVIHAAALRLRVRRAAERVYRV